MVARRAHRDALRAAAAMPSARGLMRDASKFQPGDLALLGLEGDRGGEEPPIELGQHHLHGEVGLRKPARRVLPGFAARSGEHDLQDRGAGRFQRRRRIVEAGGERGGIEHDSGRPVAQRCGDEVARVAILEAGDVKRSNIEALAVERPRQRLDGREVGGEQIGAVEHDRRKRASRHLRHVETMHAMHGKQLGSKTVVRRESRKMRHEIERAAHVLRPASGEEGIEPRQRRAIDGRKLGEPRVVAAVAREQRKWNVVRTGGVGDLLGTVAPIVEAAEQTDHHAARAGDHLLDIEIDRHRVAEPRKIGEAERRSSLAPRGPRSGERTKVAVGEGQEHEVGARLAEIDGGFRLVQSSRLAHQEMHGLAQNLIFDRGAIEPALADHHDMALPYAIRPGTVEGRAEARAHPLHRKAQRLAGDRHEALDAEHVMRFGDGLQPRQQLRRIADLRHRYDEALEIVMLMRAVERVVMRGARGEIVLCRGAETEQDVGIHPALLRRDHLHGARHDCQRRRASAVRPHLS